MTDDRIGLLADQIVRIMHWLRHIKQAIHRENRFKPDIRDVFEEQLEETRRLLRRSPPQPKQIDGVEQKQATDTDVDQWLFDPEDFEATWVAATTPHITDAVISNGKRAVREVNNQFRLAGRDPVVTSFDESRKRIKNFIDRKAIKLAEEVDEETLRLLRRQLKIGIDLGEGIPEISKRVDNVFGFNDKVRATRIARTEINSAVNFGGWQGGIQAKAVWKVWITVRDARVRDIHRSIDGQQVPINERFSNGLRFPGDPQGPPEEVINCRCSNIHLP